MLNEKDIQYIILERVGSILDDKGKPFAVAFWFSEAPAGKEILLAFSATCLEASDEHMRRFQEDLAGRKLQTSYEARELFHELCQMSVGPIRSGEGDSIAAAEIGSHMNRIFGSSAVWPLQFLDVTLRTLKI